MAGLTHRQAFTMYLKEWRDYGETQADVDFGEFMRETKEMVKCEVCLRWFEYPNYTLIVAGDWLDEWYVCLDHEATLRSELEHQGYELIESDY